MLGSPLREHLKQTRTPLGYTASILLDIRMWHFEHALSSVTTTLLCISCTATTSLMTLVVICHAPAAMAKASHTATTPPVLPLQIYTAQSACTGSMDTSLAMRHVLRCARASSRKQSALYMHVS